MSECFWGEEIFYDMYVSVTFIKDSGRVDKDRKNLIQVNQSGSSEKKKKERKSNTGRERMKGRDTYR